MLLTIARLIIILKNTSVSTPVATRKMSEFQFEMCQNLKSRNFDPVVFWQLIVFDGQECTLICTTNSDSNPTTLMIFDIVIPSSGHLQILVSYIEICGKLFAHSYMVKNVLFLSIIAARSSLISAKASVLEKKVSRLFFSFRC